MSKIIFTNGCFDLLHPGHIRLLRFCRKLGGSDGEVFVGLNSDSSIQKLKKGRPVYNEDLRREMLLSLMFVDKVFLFSEPTPENLIQYIHPDILVKGDDWRNKKVAGDKFVRARGGSVVFFPREPLFSTTALIKQIRKLEC